MVAQASPTDWPTIFIALFTGVYTVATILIWIASNRTVTATNTQLHLLREQLHAMQQQIVAVQAVTEAETIHHITESHRQIFLTLVTNRDSLNLLATESGKSPEACFSEFVATLLINHVADVHQSLHRRHIDLSEWEGLRADIGDLFSWPFIRHRWTDIQKFYAVEFQEFIARVNNR